MLSESEVPSLGGSHQIPATTLWLGSGQPSIEQVSPANHASFVCYTLTCIEVQLTTTDWQHPAFYFFDLFKLFLLEIKHYLN